MATNTGKRFLPNQDFFRRRNPSDFTFRDSFFTVQSFLNFWRESSLGLSSFISTAERPAERPGLYIIPEAVNQFGTLYSNITRQFNQRLQYFGDGLFRIARQDVQYDASSNYHINIIGYDIYQNVRIGISTDPAKYGFPAQRVTNFFTNEGSDVYWQSAEELGFSIGDNGFILFPNFNLVNTNFDKLEFYADYYFIPSQLEYLKLELNPEISTSPIAQYKIIFLIHPIYRNTTPHQRTIYHILVDNDNLVVESTHYAVPVGTRYESAYLFEAAFNNIGLKVLGEARSSVLTLANISMLPIHILGGGIKEEYLESLIQDQSEFDWFTEIGNWDGRGGPYGNTIVANVPHYLLDENGGVFSYDDILNICKRHMVAGTNVILKFKSFDIFTSATYADGVVTLNWTDVGNFPYRIYYKAENEPTFSLLATIFSNETTYEISNLNSSMSYEFYVVVLAFGVESIPSNVATVIMPNAAGPSEKQVTPNRAQNPITISNTPPSNYKPKNK